MLQTRRPRQILWYRDIMVTWSLSPEKGYIVCSGVVRGGRKGGPLQVTPFWGDTILWCETKTPQICGEDLVFVILLGLQPHLDQKPCKFTAKTFFCFGLHLFLNRKSTTFRRRPFFFLVFTYVWTKKGWHHEVPLQVPPFLATPLIFDTLLVIMPFCLFIVFFPNKNKL